MKHLNIWTSARSAWFNMCAWQKCADGKLALSDYQGRECLLALDLAAKTDLCALVLLFPREKDERRFYDCVAPRFYLPHDTVFDATDKAAAERYQRWARAGLITVTDGAEVDYRHIKHDILSLSEQFRIREVPHDPRGAFELAHELEEAGLTPVKIPQTTSHLSPAMKELDAAILSQRLRHDGNEVLTWMISNVTAREDANCNVFPRRESRAYKIDGAVALMMAVLRAMVPSGVNSLSEHLETRGVRSL